MCGLDTYQRAAAVQYMHRRLVKFLLNRPQAWWNLVFFLPGLLGIAFILISGFYVRVCG